MQKQTVFSWQDETSSCREGLIEGQQICLILSVSVLRISHFDHLAASLTLFHLLTILTAPTTVQQRREQTTMPQIASVISAIDSNMAAIFEQR